MKAGIHSKAPPAAVKGERRAAPEQNAERQARTNLSRQHQQQPDGQHLHIHERQRDRSSDRDRNVFRSSSTS